MHILVNGDPRNLNATTCAEALMELGYAQAVVATALNGIFISAADREATTLNNGDALEILAPMQGG